MMRLAFEIVFALLTVCGVAFYLIALWSARAFLQQPKPEQTAESWPPVSILKPLKGADSQTYSALRSHCLQDYGGYELIFGVNEESDGAVALVRRLIGEFPNRDIRLVICSEVVGANRKVSNLVHLLRETKHQHVLVNDGDIRVEAGYLRNVMSAFADPKVGIVTCLYRGTASQTIASRFESLGISTDFAPGVLTALFLDGCLNFALGSTMAMSRAALEEIGSFNAVLDYLADDYQIGQRIAGAGFKVVLSQEIVETSIPAYSFSQFWEHQVRWARTMRVSRPRGYLGVGLTYALPWAIVLIGIASNAWWAWTLGIMALAARAAVSAGIGWAVLRDRCVRKDWWLIPLRDCIALMVWAWSYAGDTVTWRGEKFRLSEGRLIPLSSQPGDVLHGSRDQTRSEAQRR